MPKTGDRKPELHIEELSRRIAEKVFPHVSDTQRKNDLALLLLEFAEEIRTATIEPGGWRQ